MAAEHEEQTKRALEETKARLEAESEAKIASITEEADRRVEEMTALTASTRLAAITATAAALDQQQALEAAHSSPADDASGKPPHDDTHLLQRMGSDLSDSAMLYDPATASPMAVPPNSEATATASTPAPDHHTRPGDDQVAARLGEMAKEMFTLFSTWDEYQPVLAYANIVKQSEDVLTNVADLEARWHAQPQLAEQGQLRAKAMRIHALRVVMCYLKSQVISLSKKEHSDLKRKVDRCFDSKSAAGLIKEGYQGLKKVVRKIQKSGSAAARADVGDERVKRWDLTEDDINLAADHIPDISQNIQLMVVGFDNLRPNEHSKIVKSDTLHHNIDWIVEMATIVR